MLHVVGSSRWLLAKCLGSLSALQSAIPNLLFNHMSKTKTWMGSLTLV